MLPSTLMVADAIPAGWDVTKRLGPDAARELLTVIEELKTMARTGQLASAGPDTVTKMIDTYIGHRVAIGKLRGQVLRQLPPVHPDPHRPRHRVCEGRGGPSRRRSAGHRPCAREGLAPSSVHQIRSILHGAFKKALRERKVTAQPPWMPSSSPR